MNESQIKNAARKVASAVMSTANRHGCGIGECGYYFETYAFDFILDKDGNTLVYEYEIDTGEGIDWAERTRLKDEQPEAFATWREIVDQAKEMADTLQEMGVSNFN